MLSSLAHRWYTRNYGCLVVVTLANLTNSGGSVQIGQLFTKEISNHARMRLSWCIKYTLQCRTSASLHTHSRVPFSAPI